MFPTKRKAPSEPREIDRVKLSIEDHPAPAPEARDDQPLAAAKVPTIIARAATVQGKLVAEGEVQIDGAIDGEVQATRISVSVEGTVKGTLRGKEVLFAGKLDGEINAAKVTILKSARVEGTVRYDKLALEPGADVEAGLSKRKKPKGPLVEKTDEASNTDKAEKADKKEPPKKS